jgi:O-antigen ligase
MSWKGPNSRRDNSSAGGLTLVEGLKRGTGRDNSQYRTPAWALFAAITVCWVLAAAGMRPAGRETFEGVGGADWLAVLKLLARMGCLGVLVVVLVRLRKPAGFRSVTRALVPFGLFAAWAMVSSLWSPIPTVSFPKAVGLLTCVLLARLAAAIAIDERGFSSLIKHLAVLTLTFTLANIIGTRFYATPEMVESLNTYDMPRAGVLMHFNIAAQISGICVLLVVMGCFLFKWKWARMLLPPVAVLGLSFLWYANSRMALLATAIALAGFAVLTLNFRQILALSLLPAIIASILFIVDPLTGYSRIVGKYAADHLMRGQDAKQLEEFSGRVEKWKLALDSFVDSPIAGRGYDFISKDKMVFVNGAWQPLPAHSMYLDVLVGTGLIGALLFLWAVASAIRPALCWLRSPVRGQRRRAVFCLVMAGWFFVVGCTEVAFLSAISAVSVVAFCNFGMIVAMVVSQPVPRAA